MKRPHMDKGWQAVMAPCHELEGVHQQGGGASPEDGVAALAGHQAQAEMALAAQSWDLPKS